MYIYQNVEIETKICHFEFPSSPETKNEANVICQKN